MLQVQFTLTGLTPLLFHADDVQESDRLMEWRKDPQNKNLSVPGDDRSPAWTWQTYLYSDGEHLAWPSDNLMVGLRTAGAQMILKRQKTFKEVTQSGLIMNTEFCDFFSGDRKIPMADIMKLEDKPFKKQFDAAKQLGFELFMKRARVNKAKHVRVRARFKDWSIVGAVTVRSPEINFEVLEHLFEIAGRCGQGDWRPACSTPGIFGQFTSKLKLMK